MAVELAHVQPVAEHEPRTPSGTGCGEAVEWKGQLYFSRVGTPISRSVPTWVAAEGNYLGRVHGEKHYLIIAYNGVDFTLLEEAESGELRAQFSKYRGLSCAVAIEVAHQFAEQAAAEQAEREAAIPACPACGTRGSLLVSDVCSNCGYERPRKDTP